MRDETVTVGIPIFNEQANLAQLLDRLEEDEAIARIIAVDDGSTDASPSILLAHLATSTKLTVLGTGGGAGQLRGWLLAAQAANTKRIVFIDADSLPEKGAVAELARTADALGAVVTSGRVDLDSRSVRVPMSRFSATLVHRVRLLGYPKEAVIGRFFCVETAWFVATIERDDIIANDAYLSLRAIRNGRTVRYVPAARCRFAGASTVTDLAAQRQRADRGYEQLRQNGDMLPSDEAPLLSCLRVFAVAAAGDLPGALFWGLAQLRARSLAAYQVRGHAGTWKTQTSTKRAIGRDE